jgi:hypothetical protein
MRQEEKFACEEKIEKKEEEGGREDSARLSIDVQGGVFLGGLSGEGGGCNDPEFGSNNDYALSLETLKTRGSLGLGLGPEAHQERAKKEQEKEQEKEKWLERNLPLREAAGVAANSRGANARDLEAAADDEIPPDDFTCCSPASGVLHVVGFHKKKLKNSSEAVVKQNKAGAKQSKAVVKLFVGCLRAVCTGSMQ